MSCGCGGGAGRIVVGDNVKGLDAPEQGSSMQARKDERLGRCRIALDEYYGTDFFTNSREEKPGCVNCTKAQKNMETDTEEHLVRSLYPPYWQPDPYPPKARLTNPFKFVRRYGECPNPKPWENEYEEALDECKRTKVNTGRHPVLAPYRAVHHKKSWDSDPEIPGAENCNLWHCKLAHKRSMADRPW